MSQCPNVPMYQCSNFQMFKCSNVQIFKCSNVQMLKCSNVKYQISIRLNFCRIVHPESLRSFFFSQRSARTCGSVAVVAADTPACETVCGRQSSSSNPPVPSSSSSATTYEMCANLKNQSRNLKNVFNIFLGTSGTIKDYLWSLINNYSQEVLILEPLRTTFSDFLCQFGTIHYIVSGKWQKVSGFVTSVDILAAFLVPTHPSE